MSGALDPRYAILGCLTIDSVVTAAGELIPRACGGNSLYAAVGTHIWDTSIGLVTRVGTDYPGGCLEEIVAAVGADGIRRLETKHPVHVAFAYEEDGSRTRYIPEAIMARIPEALRPYFYDDTRDDDIYLAATPTADEIPASWLAGVDSVHLPPLLIQSHRELIGALRAALPTRLITVDSPWYDRHHATNTDHVDILPEIDAVLPSEEDLALFVPGVSLIAAARQLITHGARAVVVKLGAAGSIVIDGMGAIGHVPAYPARTVDPTGAGDSFCGGFLVGLRETGDLVQAALYGTVAASFVVEDRAAIPVFGIQRSQAEERLEAIRPLVRYDITDDPRGGRH